MQKSHRRSVLQDTLESDMFCTVMRLLGTVDEQFKVLLLTKHFISSTILKAHVGAWGDRLSNCKVGRSDKLHRMICRFNELRLDFAARPRGCSFSIRHIPDVEASRPGRSYYLTDSSSGSACVTANSQDMIYRYPLMF